MIWAALGDVPNYIEPFAGSLAVLLARPHAPRVETVNDLDAFLSNFWRATAHDPEAVARYADAPVNEADLHARHLWLVQQTAFRERMLTDPDFSDAKIAGWWVWGLCAWIGGGWCSGYQKGEGDPSKQRKRPDLGAGGGSDSGHLHNGKGVHSIAMRGPARKRPAVGGHMSNDGVGGAGSMLGVHSLGMRLVHRKIPDLGGGGEPGHATQGKGVHGLGMREPSRQLPDLGGSTKGDATFPNVGKGINGAAARSNLYAIFDALAARMRYVRVTCGDFDRVLTPAVTWRHGLTGVVLDPPYPESADRSANLYAQDSLEVAHRAAAWAVEHGDDRLPNGEPALRIAFCGYEGTHPELDAAGWRSVRWKAKGGYGGQRREGKNENAERETIWFSPHCLRAEQSVGPLFAAMGAQ